MDLYYYTDPFAISITVMWNTILNHTDCDVVLTLRYTATS